MEYQMNGSISKEEMEQIKRDISAKYGFNFDKELVPLVIELYETRKVVNANLSSAIAIMEETRDKVNATQKTYQFTSARQAFFQGFGAWGIGLMSVAVLAFLAWFIYLNQTRTRETALAFQNLEKNAKVEKRTLDNAGNEVLYLVLYPVEDIAKAEAGKHYTYDATCKCIQLPLNFVSSRK
jgi:hypothetical protein